MSIGDNVTNDCVYMSYKWHELIRKEYCCGGRDKNAQKIHESNENANEWMIRHLKMSQNLLIDEYFIVQYKETRRNVLLFQHHEGRIVMEINSTNCVVLKENLPKASCCNSKCSCATVGVRLSE